MRKDVKNPGIGSGGLFRLRDRCSHGHLYTEANTWVRKSNGRNERHCRACDRARALEYARRVKEKLFKKLGGKCAWPGCGVTDLDMLTLDHVKDDGSKHRIRGLTSGWASYRKALKEGCPKKKYQALCANHNLKKELERLRANRMQP